MKRQFLASAARTGLSTMLLLSSAMAYAADDGLAKWAATHALPVATVDSAANDSDLVPLVSAIGSARVVALGEPMHGVHEPLAFRNRLFRSLVERKGFTAIALESGFTESIHARSFIERGAGDPDTATRTGLSSGFGRYLENRELIQWMRDYNAAASSAGHRKIRLYGVDLPAGARLSGPRRALDSALTFLALADSTAAQRIRDSVSDALPPTDVREFGSLSVAAQRELDTSIEAVAKALQKSRKSLIARSSQDEYRWAEHNIQVAHQLAKCLPLTPPANADISLWPKVLTCRDSAMAANVQWALENEGRDGRLFVFAHNGHVMSAKEDGRRMAKVREKPSMMGLYLRRAYGQDLYIIAMVCATTSKGLIAATPLEDGSIESTLSAVGRPLMFLDVRMARQNADEHTWLSVPRSMNANVSAQTLITLSSAVDAFVFKDTLTPATQTSDQSR